MGNPVLIAHDAQYSPGADTSTLTSVPLTVSNGDVIVVKATTWDTGTSMSTPTGGGQTYQPAQIAAPGGFKGWSGTWVCTVTGNPGSFSISTTPSASSRHSLFVEQWGSAFVDAVPAVFTSNNGSAASMSAPFTTTADNSVISFALVDENSRDPSGHTWSPVSVVEDGLYDGHSGSNSVHYSGYVPVAATGATTVGLTVPAGSLNWTISGVEIKAVTAAPEVILAAALTGTGGLAASLGPNDTTVAAGLTATASMTAPLSVPTVGPVDRVATPVAQELLTCFTEKLATLANPPAKIQLRVGLDTGPLIGPDFDECCAGLAWVRVVQVYPSWDSFPAQDNTWYPTGPLAYAVVLEMGIAFCMPWADSEGYESMDPPSTNDWSTAFATQMQHQALMRQVAACCWLPTQRRAVGGWDSFAVEGGCTGGKLTVTVSVMAPCADC
jgi:hypothetical protein